MTTLSDNGIAVIKNFEGLRLKAYQDTAGIWTIGYGSTRYRYGKTIRRGDYLANEAQALALLTDTLTGYMNAVENLVKVPLNQNQFDALVSFAYNVGTGALKKSTLLRKLNAADYEGAAYQFLLWDKITEPSTGKKMISKTLSARRKQERELFLKPI
ncbi:lysozyme [Mucilaginibacter sp. ZB1P21]|uniref:Lysozyme n=2 Tax=Mucilaginibacter glaciei TaxID=2772109 RepID=A0A926NM37_9SPHI|nr:lysozyme [Mucilaginibacter glaciei]